MLQGWSRKEVYGLRFQARGRSDLVCSPHRDVGVIGNHVLQRRHGYGLNRRKIQRISGESDGGRAISEISAVAIDSRCSELLLSPTRKHSDRSSRTDEGRGLDRRGRSAICAVSSVVERRLFRPCGAQMRSLLQIT
eukprot:1906416-Rhodomonas_salina.1